MPVISVLIYTHFLMTKSHYNFSLLELMLVTVILGILIGISVTHFSSNEQDVQKLVQAKEMADIQRAFMRFYDDCVPADSDLEQIRRYGLWCLIQAENPKDKSTPWGTSFDFYKNKGWRGPYMSSEGTKMVGDVISIDGQVFDETEGAIEIPVITTPYLLDASASADSRNHYRVFVPNCNNIYDYKKIVVVSPGANGLLETAESIASIGTDIVAIGDDTVIRLLPFN